MMQKWMSSSLLATIILLHVMWNSALAQSTGTPDSDCSNSLLSLINCEPFLAGDNVSTPPDSCCAGLNDLVRAAPTCLCGVIAGSPTFSSINLTRALELPVKCGIPMDRGQCEAIGAPPPSPSSRPSPSHGITSPSPSTGSKMPDPSLMFWSSLLGFATLLTNPPVVW